MATYPAHEAPQHADRDASSQHVSQLREARPTWPVIDEAEQAFRMLADASQREDRNVPDIAEARVSRARAVIEFLTTQLDQEETLARAATSGPWEACAVGHAGSHVVRPAGSCEWVSQVSRQDRAEQEADAAHIARHDPEHTLREVRAKRAILARAHDGSVDSDAALEILVHLAAVYADHPAYRQDWGPEQRIDAPRGKNP